MDRVLDLAIIGSGPSALTAGIYAARSELSVKIFERKAYGGSLTEIAYIANFPGFDGEGMELANGLKSQAETAGVEFDYGECTEIAPAVDIDLSEKAFALTIDGERVLARSIIIATGSEPRKMDLDTDKPISYCALCDAPLYKDKKILVIGGGNSAVGESLMLAEYASELTLINRSPLRAEKTLISQLKSLSNTKIEENVLDFTKYLDSTDGIFVFIGKKPASDFFATSTSNFSGEKLTDDDGYILTDADNMTKIPGIFAAGDVRQGSIKQAITAASDGAVAAISVKNYLTSVKK